MKRICTICARGGSKGVPNKNIRDIAGEPLIRHSIRQAKESNLFDYIAISSDSDEILEACSIFEDVELIKRPAELATDAAAKNPVIIHLVKTIEEKYGIEFDTVVDLDCTSLLRVSDDIVQSVKMLEASDANNVLTVAPARRSPYFNQAMYTEDKKASLVIPLEGGVFRRQDSPEVFDLNASVYPWKRKALEVNKSVYTENTLLYIMPEERSLDIDNEFEFEVVKYLFEKRVGWKPSTSTEN